MACLNLCAHDFTPTERYLGENPIRKVLDAYYYFGIDIDKRLPFFMNIIAGEKEEGFVGYHGCSQRYRLFQDILRALFEERFGISIPQDFQFLRIPGDPLFDLKDNKQSFYRLFDRVVLPKKEQCILIDTLFIIHFNARYGTSLTAKQLSNKEFAKLWGVLLDFLETLDLLALEDQDSFDDTVHADGSPFLKADKKIKKKSIAKDAFVESVCEKLSSMIKFVEAEERSGMLKKKLFHSHKVKAALVSVFTPKLPISALAWDLQDWAAEEAKFITFLYHVRDDFGWIFDEAENRRFARFFFPYFDHDPLQQSRLVAMNIPLYGNYYRMGECTIAAFLWDSAIAGGDDKVVGLLSDFFADAGFSPDLPRKLYNIGLEEMKKAGTEAANPHAHGCLLQFFDHSSKMGKAPYSGIDAVAFASHSFGIPIKIIQPSELVLGTHPLRHNQNDLQLRLVTSSHTTLNPNSFLRIKRYDTLDPAISKRILKKMKAALQTAPVEADKLKKQQLKFKKLWPKH